MQKKGLFVRKPLPASYQRLEEEAHALKKHLGWGHLTLFGIGAIIGGGIFVITGQAAASYAGPAIVLSFIFSAIICIFTGLCIVELSSIIPLSGGSYSHSYVVLGEFPAWIVGWAGTLQCIASAATVAAGWSGYMVSLLKDFGIFFSDSITKAPFNYQSLQGWHLSGAIFDLPAAILITFITLFISIGIKTALHFNHIMVMIKLAAIVLFIILGIPHIHLENFSPFIPENSGIFGEFGWTGMLRGAGLVFFAYVGFDTISTLAQDTINPQKDVPKGILASLGICTIAYIATALVLTGVVSYTLLNVSDPMAVALNAMGRAFFWLSFIVKLAILAALSSVVLVQLLGQTRILYAMSRDGLLPIAFGKLKPKIKTPLFSSIITGIAAILIAGLFPVYILGELVSITTLFLFIFACTSVLILRYTHPEYERPFKVPLIHLVSIGGIVSCLLQMYFLTLSSWMQLACWLILGLAIYFTYSIRHSVVRTIHK